MNKCFSVLSTIMDNNSDEIQEIDKKTKLLIMLHATIVLDFPMNIEQNSL